MHKWLYSHQRYPENMEAILVVSGCAKQTNILAAHCHNQTLETRTLRIKIIAWNVFCTTEAYQVVKIIALRLKNLPRISRIAKTGRNTTVPHLTTSHSGWMVSWLRPRSVYCASVGLQKKWNPSSSGLLMYDLMYEQHWHMHRQCASVILQDDRPPVSSVNILPETQTTQYYQSWRLGRS